MGKLFINAELHNQIKSIFEELFFANRLISFGRIQDYNAATHSVRVQLLPQLGELEGEDNLTGFIPLHTPWAGQDWGMQCAPKDGEAHVLVFFLSPPSGPAYALGPFYTITNRPVGDVEKGEFLLQHESGTKVKLFNDSSILIEHVDGSHVLIDAESSIEILHKLGSKITIDTASDILAEHRAGGKIHMTAGQIDVHDKVVNIKGDTSVNIDAPTINVQGTTTTIQGTAILSLISGVTITATAPLVAFTTPLATFTGNVTVVGVMTAGDVEDLS